MTEVRRMMKANGSVSGLGWGNSIKKGRYWYGTGNLNVLFSCEKCCSIRNINVKNAGNSCFVCTLKANYDKRQQFRDGTVYSSSYLKILSDTEEKL